MTDMPSREPVSPLALLGRKFRGALRRMGRLWLGSEARLAGEVAIADGRWRVEVAMTARRRWVGLGGRSQLARGTGMLFIYPDAVACEFSMRGCLVPLDIAFLSESLEVVSLETMEVEPDRAGRRKYACAEPAQYVLETPAGELARASVTVGSKAVFSADIPSPRWSDPPPQAKR